MAPSPSHQALNLGGTQFPGSAKKILIQFDCFCFRNVAHHSNQSMKVMDRIELKEEVVDDNRMTNNKRSAEAKGGEDQFKKKSDNLFPMLMVD